jgi:hypothetical protein
LEPRKRKNYNGIAAAFLVVGVLMLLYSLFSGLQIAAFIGLGLTFWGALFSVARTGKYVESSILDVSAKSAYSTTDRMINDLKFKGQAYYLPAYPQDVNLPQYLNKLREPVVFISEAFDGKLAVEELASGKFLSAKNSGVFITSPGSGIMSQMEKQFRLDFSKLDIQELVSILPKSLTEQWNLAKKVEMSFTGSTVVLKAAGILYDSLYRAEPPLKSLSILGCPLVSAVASAIAKTSGKTVILKEHYLSPNASGVYVVFNFF